MASSVLRRYNNNNIGCRSLSSSLLQQQQQRRDNNNGAATTILTTTTMTTRASSTITSNNYANNVSSNQINNGGRGGIISFSTKQQQQKKNKKNKKSGKEEEKELSYFERKVQRKEYNRVKYANQLSKKQQLLHRRDNSSKDVLKKQFNDWWESHKAFQEMMNRKSKQQSKEWKIYVSIVLERLPVVLPDKPNWQIEYENLHAYLGQFGKDYPKELFPEHADANANAADDSSPIPLSDEELFALLPDHFKPSPRETEADSTGDIHTMDRKLKDRVYYMIQKNNNDTGKKEKGESVGGGENDDPSSTMIEWTFPTVELKLVDELEQQQQESLLEAAERAISDVTKKTGMNLYCPSNAPIACKMDLFDDENNDEGDDDNKYMGTKTFFMRIQYDDDEYKLLKTQSKKQAWLDRNEIVDNVQATNGVGASKFYHYML